jgi:hypothetical protein
MSDETRAEASLDDQNRQLRARISELEEEVASVRRALHAAELGLDWEDPPVSLLQNSIDAALVGFAWYSGRSPISSGQQIPG